MIAVTDEQEIFSLHSCIGRISDPDSNVIKELTSKVFATIDCVCDVKGYFSESAEINNNNNEETREKSEDGAKFIKKLFGLVIILKLFIIRIIIHVEIKRIF